MSLRLARIDLHPIKSFDSVSVESARILPAGCLEQDRRFAVFDDAGRVVNGKRTPAVHRLRFDYEASFENVTATDRRDGSRGTFPLNHDRHRLEEMLSDHFGFAVHLRENVAAGFPDDTESPGPTVIARETLETVADWFGFSFDDARRRFRANLMIEGGGPFWDDRLFAAPGETVTFRIGSVWLFGVNPCARCAVPSRDPATGETHPGFAKRFMARRRESLPDWSEPSAFDHHYRLAVNTRLYAPPDGGVLRVGDEVELRR